MLYMKENKLSRAYILITPARNEEKNLPSLIQSVTEQTIKPVLWVIVDDGSTDDTPQIVKEAEEKYSFIKSIRLNDSDRNPGFPISNALRKGFYISNAMRKGFDFAIEYCMKNRIDYEYLGNVDGDIILEEMFFEKLIKEFEKDPMLGIAGGGILYIRGNRIIQEKGRIDEPSGANMLIRKEFFEECGGIPPCCPDSVLKAKARLRGWKTKRFEGVKALETRDVNPKIRNTADIVYYWKRYIYRGAAAYYLNTHPIHVMAKGIRYLCKKPYFTGIAYLLGYFSSFIRRKEQIDDEEIKNYFWNKWKKILRRN